MSVNLKNFKNFQKGMAANPAGMAPIMNKPKINIFKKKKRRGFRSFEDNVGMK